VPLTKKQVTVLWVRNLAFLCCYRGEEALLLLRTVGSAWPLWTVGGSPPSTQREAKYYSMEKFGFQCLDRWDRSLL
jgi:hypothetical protein